MTRSDAAERDQPDSLHLRQGPTELALSPGQGGAIIGWHHGGTSLMRTVQPGQDGTVSVRQLASYPLIPFSNRIAHGQFSFEGQSYTLPGTRARRAMRCMATRFSPPGRLTAPALPRPCCALPPHRTGRICSPSLCL
ncbi:hypothetical protein GT370_08845 [Acidocella sp. MX-AZ03]|uniref:hypothetical protein n=1 Tax=Acidocella sp. MX-AZ03 TaxID=2697363 RepID=UPI0022DD327C|nr:hypothetical protein [Acidocella sp. MX-AZ03]WBO60823.1 hypothetical protein GT370_08845 [Acidocella sp. MX-AZ03]